MSTAPIESTPRLPIPNGYQMSVQLNQAGQPAAVVLGGYRENGPMTQAIAEQWYGAAWAMLKAITATSTLTTGAVVRDVSSSGGQVWECTAPTGNAGLGQGTLAVAAASTLIKWRTAFGGRSGKGRTFVPGLVASAIDGNGRTLIAGHVTFVQGHVNTYLGSDSTVVVPSVLSFKRGLAYAIEDASVASTVAIQRRRMRA